MGPDACSCSPPPPETGWAEPGVVGAGAHPSNALPPKKHILELTAPYSKEKVCLCPRLQGRSSQQPVFTAAPTKARGKRGKNGSFGKDRVGAEGQNSHVTNTLRTESPVSWAQVESTASSLPPTPHLPRPGPGSLCLREQPFPFLSGETVGEVEQAVVHAPSVSGFRFYHASVIAASLGPGLLIGDSPAVLGGRLHL